MINTKRSKNKNWETGSVVKVGFLSLKVTGIKSVKESKYDPETYELESIDGSKKYEFTPYNGLYRVEGK